jgi:hypothetical protein
MRFFYLIAGYSAPMLVRTLAGGALLVASLHAAPATAQALPTMQPLKPCYVTAATAAGPQSEGMEIVANGFTPNSSVRLTIDGGPVEGGDALQVGNTGELRIPADDLKAPFVESGSKPFTVRLTEVENPANFVEATAMSTALGVTLKPASARPSKRIRFKGRGFTEDKPIYAHYVRKGKLRKTVRMARRPGDCGSFKKRRRQIPVKNPGLGTWTVQFDQSKRLVDPAVTPINFVRLMIRVRLVPR